MLILIVFALGAKHGMDPDHLATIDGLTRFNAQRRPRLARWSGCLFSLGHGLVVTAVATAAASLSSGFLAPAWLEHTSAWISIAFLAALGAGNIAAVWRTPHNKIVRNVGLRARAGWRRSRAPIIRCSSLPWAHYSRCRLIPGVRPRCFR